MSSTTLYSQEELLSLYKQSIQDNKDDLLKVLKKGTLVPFTILGIINDSQKESWSLSNMTQNESRGALIQHILKSDDVSDYIKFSRCVRYISDVGAGRVFSFMQDLINVGLHDPISKGSVVTLSPRLPTSPGKSVVLWIICAQDLFQHVCRTLISGRDHPCPKGYVCQKARESELYAVHRNSTPTSPGRKFDDLLASFEPCPTLLVCSGSCQPVIGPSLDCGHSVVAASPLNFKSEFDLSAEVVHASHLLKLRGTTREGVHVGSATRYASEEGANIHCPDAISLHCAATKCQIPAVALMKAEVDEDYCKYVYNVVTEMIDTM